MYINCKFTNCECEAFMTNNENTINDSYLIVKKSGDFLKMAYLKNLISELKNSDENMFVKIKDLNVYNIAELRKAVQVADEYGVRIYHLTRL